MTVIDVLWRSVSAACGVRVYRGTSLIRNSLPLGSYGRACLGPYGGPRRGMFLMSEVPL